MNAQTHDSPETQFNRGAWLIILFSILIITYAIAAIAYRFTLPTDGWEISPQDETYIYNLMGGPSGLQPGDVAVAIQGYPVQWDKISPNLPSLRLAWQAGATLTYTVLRDGQQMEVPVTLVNWQFGKWLSGKLRNPEELIFNFSVFLLIILAFFVFLRRPANPTAGAFLMLFVMFAGDRIGSLLPSGLPELIDESMNVWVKPITDFLGGVILPFVMIRFALIFPHPKPVLLRFPWLVNLPIAAGLVMFVFLSESFLSWLWIVLSLILTVAIILHNAFTMRDSVSRAQLLWGLGGLLFGFGSITLLILLNTTQLVKFKVESIDLVFAISFLVMGICLAIAITRYHLFDIDVIIRKTLVYSLLSGILGLVYFGGVALLQGILTADGRLPTAGEPDVSRQPSAVVIVATTLTIAALFNPLRRRLQEAIDRRFYRQKYDAEKSLAEFAAVVRSETDLPQITNHLAGAVQETLQPERVGFWLKRQG